MKKYQSNVAARSTAASAAALAAASEAYRQRTAEEQTKAFQMKQRLTIDEGEARAEMFREFSATRVSIAIFEEREERRELEQQEASRRFYLFNDFTVGRSLDQLIHKEHHRRFQRVVQEERERGIFARLGVRSLFV